MDKLSLGILIPTWDRPEQVSARVAEIAFQFGCDQRIHVQVNPGDYDSSSLNCSPLASGVTVSQNQSNVGFVANILLGMMSLDDEWVWILGDDDSLLPTCASTIRLALSLATDNTIAVVFNQWGRKEIENCRCTKSSHLFLLRPSVTPYSFLARYGVELTFFIILSFLWFKRFLALPKLLY